MGGGKVIKNHIAGIITETNDGEYAFQLHDTNNMQKIIE
jgi:hypothetical protein